MSISQYVYVAVNFLFQLIFVFPLFVGMVMHANEFETKEKQKLTEIKNKLQHIRNLEIECNKFLCHRRCMSEKIPCGSILVSDQ